MHVLLHNYTFLVFIYSLFHLQKGFWMYAEKMYYFTHLDSQGEKCNFYSWPSFCWWFFEDFIFTGLFFYSYASKIRVCFFYLFFYFFRPTSFSEASRRLLNPKVLKKMVMSLYFQYSNIFLLWSYQIESNFQCILRFYFEFLWFFFRFCYTNR